MGLGADLVLQDGKAAAPDPDAVEDGRSAGTSNTESSSGRSASGPFRATRSRTPSWTSRPCAA